MSERIEPLRFHVGVRPALRSVERQTLGYRMPEA
jgi:hypothetical protein